MCGIIALKQALLCLTHKNGYIHKNKNCSLKGQKKACSAKIGENVFYYIPHAIYTVTHWVQILFLGKPAEELEELETEYILDIRDEKCPGEDPNGEKEIEWAKAKLKENTINYDPDVWESVKFLKILSIQKVQNYAESFNRQKNTARRRAEKGLKMSEKKKYEPLMLSKSGKITVYTEIIQRCGMCMGRTEDPAIEKELANVAVVLSSALATEFEQKDK